MPHADALVDRLESESDVSNMWATCRPKRRLKKANRLLALALNGF